MSYPFHIFLLLVLIVIVIVIALALNKRTSPTNKRIIYISIGALIGWLALLAMADESGFFRDFQTMPPRIAFGLIPMVTKKR